MNYWTDPRNLGEATCCRVWVVHLACRIGRCGICDEIPTLTKYGLD